MDAQNFNEIAAEAFAEDASDEVVAEETPDEGTSEAADEHVEESVEGEAGDTEVVATEEAAEVVETDEVDNIAQAMDETFTKLDPTTLSPQLQGVYKSMQADYTRKMEAVKQAREAAAAPVTDTSSQDMLMQKLEEIRTQNEEGRSGQAQQQPAPTDQQAGTEPPEDYLYFGIPKEMRVTEEQAVSAQDPQVFMAYVRQQAVADARREIWQYDRSRVGPRVEHLETTMTAQQNRELQAEVTRFFTENSDLAPHREEVANLVRGGMEPAKAAEVWRSYLKGQGIDSEIAKAREEGFSLGASRKAEITENQDRFSTPSSSTRPGAGTQVDASMSFEEIAHTAAGL